MPLPPPHITPGRYDNTLESITEAYEQFKSDLATAEIDLTLGMAAEVRLDPVILEMVKQDKVPFLGEYQGEKIMLLEFPHSLIPPGSEELVKWLIDAGIRPLIAHPERNKAVQQKLSKLDPFVKAGCLLQITAGSLTGVFGDEAHKRAVQLLKSGTVTIFYI
jgi:protein-tyrosine phosphatase